MRVLSNSINTRDIHHNACHIKKYTGKRAKMSINLDETSVFLLLCKKSYTRIIAKLCSRGLSNIQFYALLKDSSLSLIYNCINEF